METATLRITHASTGEEYVYTSDADEVGAGPLASSRTAEGVDVAAAEVEVPVRAETLLGARTKAGVPAGRHRACLTVGGAVVVCGVVTAEGVAHGREYVRRLADGTERRVRRWSVTVRDDAADQAWAALEGVTAAAAVQRVLVETAVMTGATPSADVRTFAWRELPVLVQELVGEAGLALARTLPGAFPLELHHAGGVRTVAPTVVVGSPQRPVRGEDPDIDDDGVGLDGWTGAEVLEAWAEAQALLVTARYDAYPARTVLLDVAEVGFREPDALPQAVDAYLADYDWATEPAVVDGDVVEDLALTYGGGVDGSRIGEAGLAEAPERATYAARRWRLSGGIAPARVGGRETENDETLELPFRLVGLHQPSDVDDSAGSYVGAATVGTPAVDVALENDVVYMTSVQDVGGTLRAVGARSPGAPAPGAPAATGELWAGELFARLGTRYGDVEVVQVTVPTGTPGLALSAGGGVDLSAVALMDPSTGVALEGLAWAVRAVEHDPDRRSATLTLVRPSAGWRSGTGGAAVDGGPQELAPSVSGRLLPEEPVDGAESWYRAEWDVAVPAESATPDRIELDASQATPNGADGRTTTSSPRALTYRSSVLLPSGTSPHPLSGATLRARAVYPGGRESAWAEDTV